VKICTIMKKGEELNKNIESKSLHHFVQMLLVPSVRQQVAKPHVLIRSHAAKLFKEGGETVLDKMHRICVAIWETAGFVDIKENK